LRDEQQGEGEMRSSASHSHPHPTQPTPTPTEDLETTNTSNQYEEQHVCEQFMKLIEQLRYSIKTSTYIFSSMKRDNSSLIKLDCDLYWTCISLLFKYFIGMPTLSDEIVSRMKKNYEFYDIQTNDCFRKSTKWLKIATVCYDSIYINSNHNITPKHFKSVFFYVKQKQQEGGI
jgi:hypothetical protein